MVFFIIARAKLVFTYAVKRCVNAESQGVKSVAVAVFYTLVYLFKTNSAHTAYGVGKVAVNNLLLYTDSLENLGGLI